MSVVPESLVQEPATLIDELLREQRSLTAVSRFSRLHEEHALPAHSRYYRALIPLHAPRENEQYAFEVDLDQCSGCKGCVTACHSLNGLDEEEAWRNVGQLTGGINGHAMQQTVTTACHHCVDPGCMNGCPVLAYEKDPTTGIVSHLDDQCIGCQYCVMKCPYDVPKYSERLGIVRKCDMCSQRLGEGEAPACVQACPNEAIKITVVNQIEITTQFREPDLEEASGYAAPDFEELAAEISEFGRTNNFLPGSPEPDYTLPTTRYKTKRPRVAALRAADEVALKPQHAHWPLIPLLVLSQLSVGLTGGAFFLLDRAKPLVFASTISMGLALALATFHLGRPMKAWRAFLGWRKSWFSREAIAFGGYMGTLVLAVALFVLDQQQFLKPIIAAAFITGLVSVFCSLMVYVDTRREFWSAYHTGVRFVGTTLLMGYPGSLMLAAPGSAIAGSGFLTIALLVTIKLLFEASVLSHWRSREWTPLKRTARLIAGPLRKATGFRVFSGLIGGLLFPLLAVSGLIPAKTDVAMVIFVILLAGELAERFLFFTAVSPTQMPGGIPS